MDLLQLILYKITVINKNIKMLYAMKHVGTITPIDFNVNIKYDIIVLTLIFLLPSSYILFKIIL